jgi:ribose 5-phosphate isomerase A
MVAKKAAAIKAVAYIENGMTIGLGTGSTAAFAIEAIGEKIRQGLNVQAVASSLSSETMARAQGIDIISFDKLEYLDLSIDGADEVDEHANLIKGGGGALLREKIIAANSKRYIVIVDESKLVKKLGKFPLAIEILSFAHELTLKNIEKLEAKTIIRQVNGKPFITDNGNLIADADFFPIEDPLGLDAALHAIPGVIETGIFTHQLVERVIVGYENGKAEERLVN